MNNKIQDIVDQLGLEPHPEGGYFKETYRSQENLVQSALDPEYGGDRSCSTAIYFMLTSDSFSAFHRIHQDEIWHFYQGSPVTIHMISPRGEYNSVDVGQDLGSGLKPQLVIPGGYWFGATVVNPDDFSLVGCTVAPGFDFQDFELAQRAQLLESYPQHSQIINRLTRV